MQISRVIISVCVTTTKKVLLMLFFFGEGGKFILRDYECRSDIVKNNFYKR